jgi:glycosyltransferase involved in cell wall biosynthesis
MNPKVSVVMSAYNAEKFLEEAVESILRQIFIDFEFLIVDDASTDKTSSILKNFSYKDPRIKIITNEENIGLTKSLNKALGLSRGEYIARMDADDVSYPNRLEDQVRFLDSHSDIGIVGGAANSMDEHGTVTGEIHYPTQSKELKRILINYNPFIHSTLMFRSSVLKKAGGYNEKFHYAQDHELLLRIARVSNIANLETLVLGSRRGNYSITRKNNKPQALCALKARFQAIKRGQYPFYKIVYLLRPSSTTCTAWS